MSQNSAPLRETQAISRRNVLRTVGAGGLAATTGLTGCLVQGESGPRTVQIAANTDVKNNLEKIQSKLYEVGLSKDIELQAIAGVASTGARKQQYNRWLSANLSKPTLFMMDSGWTIPFILRDQLLSITESRPELAQMIQDSYFETFTRSLEDPAGDLYGVPLFPTTGSILYRKDLVKEAGFSPEKNSWATEPLSWKKFSKVTKETKEQTDTKYGFTFQANTYEGLSCCDFREFTGTWGGSYFGSKENLFGPVGKRPVTVDSDPVVKSTRMIRTFIDGDADDALEGVAGDIAPRAVLQWQEQTSRKPFKNGDAVMHRNWPYAINLDGAEEQFGKDLGVMPIPYGVKQSEAEYEGYGGTVSSLGGWHMTLNPNSEKTEMGLEILEAMTEPEFQLFLFEQIGWLPPRPELFNSKRAREVPVMGRYVETLQKTVENSAPRPVTVAWPQESTKISQKANAAFSGDTAPRQAMESLASQLKRIENASERGETAKENSDVTPTPANNTSSSSNTTTQPTTSKTTTEGS